MLGIFKFDKPRPKAMFNFMKKDKGGGSGTDDKERKKKEDKKKEKKEKKRDRDHDTGPCTAEEISRLEEVRRSYFGRRKKVKGHTEATSPTAEQDDSSTASMSPITSPNDSNKNLMMESQAATGNGKLTYSNTNLTTREANWSPSKPPVPPKPTKRGILKGTSSFRMEAQTSDFIQTVDDDERLVINTIANEEYIYDIPSRIKSSFQTADTTALTKSPVSTSSEYSSAAQSPVQSPMTPLASAMDAGEGVGDSHAIKNYSVELKLPAISGPRLPKVRTLTLSRQTSGDFGFCLRRAFTDLGHLPQNVADSSGTASKRKESLFAEPKEFNRNNPTGLLPGDRLLEVNDTSVAEMTREEVADLIRASGDAVKLVVQPVPELSELTVRSTSDGTEIELDESHIKTGTLTRSASRRLKKQAAKSENQLASEKAWLNAQKAWVIHKGGYASAVLMPPEPGDAESLAEGKIRVKLEPSGDIIEVDEEDVEKANPPQFDRVEDLAQLRHLNESSVLHTIRERYASSLIHTYASSSMIILNPMRQLSIYTEKVIQMFKGCKKDDMPPHVYAVAQSAYRQMLTTRLDQSLVTMGRSGSGKTVNFYHIISYLCHAAGTSNRSLTVEKLRAITTLLEYFGECRTSLNTSATRYTVIFSLDFEHSGQIANASLQVFMLDKERVVRRPEGEGTFKIFYYLLAGLDDKLRKEFFLEKTSDPNLFFNFQTKNEDAQQASLHWGRAQGSLEMLGVKEDESKAIWSVLAAIYHLGGAGVEIGASGKGQFKNPQSAQRAAILLGTTIEELSRIVFQSDGHHGLIPPPRNAFRTSPTDKNGKLDRPLEAIESLEGLAIGLYCEAFNALLSLMNRAISSNARTIMSILVLDTPGFQNPAACGRHYGATFEDLCHNYIHERLQLLFYDHTIVAQQDKYNQERIEYAGDDMEASSHSDVVHFIDKPPQQGLMRASNLDLRNVDQKGLLWLLDEEAIFPGSSDESFLERLFLHDGNHNSRRLLQKSLTPMHFVIQHLQGTNPVLYNADGWLKACRENPNIRSAILLLQDSQKESISKLFVTNRGPLSMTVSGSVVGIEGTSSLRRASSIRRTFTTGTAGVKRKSVCLQVKFQVDGIIETLRRTRLHFIHCMLPQHNAGLCELKTTILMPSKTSCSEEILINVPLIRSQLRGANILDSVRLHKQGFPDHVLYSEFRRQFELLAPPEVRQSSPILDERKTAEILMEHLDIDKTQYRLGLSQIFFRSGALVQLEEQRDERLRDTVVQFQALCRGHLARKKFAKLKVQDMAIRCIQRNVRKFMIVKSWPWWRLLVKVLPLLNVHRTEEELREKSEELENLKVKLEKLEKERVELKHENNKLETKVSELTADLAEEHTLATHASEMLEAESSERMKLEKELQDIQNKYSNLQQLQEHMEMEVMEVRMLRASEMNGDLSADEDLDASIYKQRYENTRRELEFMKKKLQQQVEDEVEQHMSAKKAFDKKLSEALDDTEQHRQIINQWKRKLQRATQELNDLRYTLEEQTARNAALEKKQRKFDADLHVAQEEIRQEKLLKEKHQRERDQVVSEKYTLEQELQSLKLEMEMKDEKLNALSRELDDLTFGNKGDEEIAHLKRAKHELELKLKEQEDELDDLTGQVQMLEQTKLRLEMNLENMRKEHRKELSQRDEEIEETRNNCQKKLKLIEHQLEIEHDDRQALIREKHELERKITELQDRPVINHDAETVHRLRKDLKRTKALLKDAQMMLERSKGEAPTKSVIRQLRNQLEDAEFAKTAAIKARQGAELELQEALSQLDDVCKSKGEMEKKLSHLSRETHELQAHLEENEEELAEVMKKYKAAVAQLSVDQLQLTDLAAQVSNLELERNMLKEQLSDMSGKLELLEGETVSTHEQKRLELKLREMETRLELETTTKGRLEVQLNRLKETVEKLTEECTSLRAKEQHAQEANRRLQRQLRDFKEDYAVLQQKEMETSHKKHELELALEGSEAEILTTKSDLKLALKRIEDLQAAMEDNAESDETESGSESDSSDSSMDTLVTHRPRPSLLQNRLSVGGTSAFSDSAYGRASSIGESDVVSRSDHEEDITAAQSEINFLDPQTDHSQESVV